MIPTPKLDDRNFQDIVDEAIRLIPQYCPEWTNYNVSDPGITLIELFAWMMEMVLYRLNRVPDKNYIAFLNLLGIRMKAPQPARTVLTFAMSDKGDYVKVAKGTTVATRPSPDGKVQSFETDQDLLVVRNRISRCFSQYGKWYSDHGRSFDQPLPEGFDPFAGAAVAERYIYLGSPGLAALTEGASLRIRFRCPHPYVSDLLDHLDWEMFDGERWNAAIPTDESDAESVVLPAPKAIAPTKVNDVESCWVRARLVDVPSNPEVTVVDSIRCAIKVGGEGLLADSILTRSPDDVFIAQDPGRRMYPFGKEPKRDTEFYFQCEPALSHKGALVRLDVAIEGGDADRPNASEDLALKWEYYNARSKKWRQLARSTFKDGRVETAEGAHFADSTLCFTRTGGISFEVPEDLSPVEVNGNAGLFVRCRIDMGDYGVPGTYELDADKWVFKDKRPLRPPLLRELAIRFEEKEHGFDTVLAENDLVFADYSEIAQIDYKPFQPLSPVAEASPTLYIGFEDSFPNEEIQFYVQLKEESGVRDPLAGGAERPGTNVVVAWEYWNGRVWQNLFPQDETRGFLQSGFVRFIGPIDFRKCKRFDESLFYVRARLEMGGYVEPPRVLRVLLNSVYASNLTSFAEMILGSSEGTPGQSFKLPQGQVLPGQQIAVLERDRPTDNDMTLILDEEGEDAVWQDKNGQGWWVRWHEVEDLYESGPNSRHYTKDIISQVVSFGDGMHGMVPAKGDRNVRLLRYQLGGGMSGNVAPGTIVVLKQTLSFIEGVKNLIPAGGGADLETIEEVKARAPHLFRSRFRAVTAEDFEWIARQASSSVARSRCIPCKDREGEVTVVIVPKVAEEMTDQGVPIKPLPSTELMRRVKAELDQHKLVSTILHVVRPRYRNLHVAVTVIRQPSGSAEAVKSDIVKKVREFLHPLRGGKNRRGWPFGRPVSKVDIYHVCEQVGGVDFVDKVAIRDLDTSMELDFVRLGDDELPFVVTVEVIERAHERIL